PASGVAREIPGKFRNAASLAFTGNFRRIRAGNPDTRMAEVADMARRKEGWKVLSVEAPMELVERMKASAERNHRSLSGEAVAAMERHVAAEEAARPAEAAAGKAKARAKKGGGK